MDGRRDAVPAGALGPAARAGQVAAGADEREHRALLDSLATLGGPLAAAVLLAASGPAAVFVACAAASLLGRSGVVALPYDAPPRADAARAARARDVQGFPTIAADRRLS